jgi:hypothetical protein
MKFTYSSGQRVLDGYTLKRGIGRGGFGEVYYALSDGGKEVALKLVRGHNLDVELRGMAQCLNLKHPNLLTLYDLRTDSQGDHWVMMEYINGEPLSAVLNRHPQGLPLDLVQQWFPALCQAVGYLHEHGIVHRDLKPGNIFIENGTVKVGDYGLSKFISSSQHTAQTQSIGTVHYMAPEISTGNYNKQIDIYAAGVILYEMLTGQVPFDGESTGEILMKHLTSPPDLSKVPAEFVPIVSQALAKNPAQRYATMTDVGKAVAAVGAQAYPQAIPVGDVKMPVAQAAEPDAAGLPSVIPVESPRGQVAELCGSLALTALFAALATMLWAAVGRVNDLTDLGAGFFLTVAVCWAVLVPAKFWNSQRGDSGVRRAVMMILGVLVGLGSLWLDGWTIGLPTSDSVWTTASTESVPSLLFGQRQGIPIAAGYLSYFGLAFFALRWWKLADPRRSQRFSFAPILATGFWALVLLLVWPWPQVPQGAVPLVVASAIIQLVSPWDQPPPPTAKRVRLRYS